MKLYLIERDLPDVGGMMGQQLAATAAKSNAKLGGQAWRIQSIAADDKTFCIYPAENLAAFHECAGG